MKSIGMVIRELRKRKGLKLEELAHAVGADTGGLSRFERGKQGYSPQLLESLAEALGVPIPDLWALTRIDAPPIIRSDIPPDLLPAVNLLIFSYRKNPDEARKVARAVETFLES